MCSLKPQLFWLIWLYINEFMFYWPTLCFWGLFLVLVTSMSVFFKFSMFYKLMETYNTVEQASQKLLTIRLLQGLASKLLHIFAPRSCFSKFLWITDRKRQTEKVLSYLVWEKKSIFCTSDDEFISKRKKWTLYFHLSEEEMFKYFFYFLLWCLLLSVPCV